MHKPIIENGYLRYKNLFIFLKKNIKSLLKFPLLVFVLFIFYILFFKSYSYKASVEFYTSYRSPNETSFANPFVQNYFIGQQKNLNFSIDNFLNSERFLDEIVNSQYYINGEKKNLVDYWGEDYNKIFSFNPLAFLKNINNQFMLSDDLTELEKKKYFAKAHLRNSMFHSQERLSDLHKITVTVRSNPQLAMAIVSNIYNSIVDFSSEVVNLKASEKKDFLKNRHEEILDALEKAEEELIVFLNENNNLGSPNLVIRKDRLEREINLLTQLYLSISDQLELTKLEEKNNTSSIFLLDSPRVDPNKAGMSLFFISNFALFLLIVFSLAWHFIKYRKELFIK